MTDVFVIADNITSPVALTTADNWSSLVQGVSGIKQHTKPEMANESFYASLFDDNAF